MISIIIAHRGEPIGLWATISACDAQLTGIPHEYRIVSNGQKEQEITKAAVEVMERGRVLGLYKHFDDPLSPPNARHYAVQEAKGDIFCFLDNHCVLGPDFFRRALADIEHWKMDVLHTSVRYAVGGHTGYHYRLTLDKNFWGRESAMPVNEVKPYRIAMSGHGGFFVTRETWQAVGGYWDGFRGYGGEESYFDLKCALMNRKVWIDPKIIHYHYGGPRGYDRHFSDDYWRNMLMAANIIGGQQWMERVGASMLHGTRNLSARNIFDILLDAYESSAEHAVWMKNNRQRTLEETLAAFQSECVAH